MLFALAAALCAPVGSTAHAQTARTISNTAFAEWDEGAARRRLASNQVDLAVEETIAPPDINLYQFGDITGSGSAIMVQLPGTSCIATPPYVSQPLGGAYANLVLEPAAISGASAIRPGEPLVFLVEHAPSNSDPGSADTFELVIETDTGDTEHLVLHETGADTGLFAGFIRTVAQPPAPIAENCVLSVVPGAMLHITPHSSDGSQVYRELAVDILESFGSVVFDSETGAPVNGVEVTLIDAQTGQPAQVFGDDGLSLYPATVVTGEAVTDSSGYTYRPAAGEFFFPAVPPGQYRMTIQVPEPYLGFSQTSPQDLAGLVDSNGEPFNIVVGSFGEVFLLGGVTPVTIDIPVDRPSAELLIEKQASRQRAVPGDPVLFAITVSSVDPSRPTRPLTVTDRLPPQLRLRPDTFRLNGQPLPTPADIAPDGREFSVAIPALAAGEAAALTYITEVLPQARAGNAVNSATVSDDRGAVSNLADAAVRIERETIADRMTIIGRVVDGGCGVDPRTAPGVGGVRIMMEDGSYTVTDEDGRYHFEAVMPGLHVVQMDESTLPLDRAAVDCARNTRSAGRAFSRFVEGQGGGLYRTDFTVRAVAPREAPEGAAPTITRPEPLSDAEAAGAERDWLTGQQPGIDWLFPAEDYNPRTRVMRVAIKHRPGQTVRLSVNGEAAAPIAFDGMRTNPANTVSVSLWRGIGIEPRENTLVAEVVNADGSIAETLNRTIHFGDAPMRAELVRERSLLVADGVSRPVIAVRLTDRDGRPVHHGLTGDFAVPSPYFPAVEADAQQARQLAGLERARPVWHVEGDEGIAYIELEPTTVSGSLAASFAFRDGEVAREQTIDLWLEPGDRPWTIVGFAAGTVGFNHLDRNLEELAADGEEVYTDARIALYARGRVTGRWLMTLAYDSDAERDESRFQGIIDPNQYYTVYADRSARGYDAASVRRLYLRLERPQFYAMFGDFETNFNETELARYNRSFNGVRTEFRNERVSATAFVADTPYRFRRVEIQGNGLTGPYAIGSTQLLANSERVTIEVRDRLRSNLILSSETLVRHIDYDVDYFNGTIRFREPILSRDSNLNPQFIVVEYEVDGIAERRINAGARVTWSTADQRLRIGATAIRDDDNQVETTMGAVDIRWRPDDSTEVRAEFAASNAEPGAAAASGTEDPGTATAWLVEAEHHSSSFDILAYAREQQDGFGTGQISGSQNGTRKFGFDGRAQLTDRITLAASGWHEDFLTRDARRIAGRAMLEYNGEQTDGRIGLIYANDSLSDGSTAESTLIQLGATQRFIDNRLTLDAQTEFALDDADSVDFPARHQITARFAATDWLTLVGGYEIADGGDFDAQTARIGFDLAPWSGARISLAGNQQEISEYGPRTFAAFGFAQSVVLDEHWSIDFTLDGNETLNGGIDPATVLNQDHPVASGGFVGNGTNPVLTEDFLATTFGATYRGDRWSWAGRAEYRDGEREDRYGLTTSLLRQIGEGSAVGGSFSWLRAEQEGGPSSEITALEVSLAHRPVWSDWSFLNKLELRSDSVDNAIAGQPGPIGSAALIATGDLRSRRIVNSFSLNWSPTTPLEDMFGGTDFLSRSEFSFFWGTRYVSDRIGTADVKGWSNLFGADVRFDLSEHVDIGASGSIREGNGGRAWTWSAGPNIGISPVENSWITVGYNFAGFEDRDFEEARYTRSGPYVTFRLRFDQQTFSDLGF
ncbi:DUF11 domain-containing protein [Parasphingopyxis marina]|uniref:DUF11 domain-containing protein n=1 Tax=Parasphingopyxis marina TaxID=2761622 RepID=A0A842HYZ0_9SPHN|nr:DUF11 domain-containing protein [Parasphingopyxis marina]MBC2777561.1 hypothetical protein [Parasphingopyxis marina]